MRFLPITRGLNYLPFNEGMLEVKKVGISDQYVINLSLDSYFEELGAKLTLPMPHANVIVHGEKDTIQIAKTDREATLSVSTQEAPKKIELFYQNQYKSVLLLNLEEFGEYELFANVRNVLANLGPDGCGGVPHGPTKEMKIRLDDNNEIVEIHDIDINLKQRVFQRK